MLTIRWWQKLGSGAVPGGSSSLARAHPFPRTSGGSGRQLADEELSPLRSPPAPLSGHGYSARQRQPLAPTPAASMDSQLCTERGLFTPLHWGRGQPADSGRQTPALLTPTLKPNPQPLTQSFASATAAGTAVVSAVPALRFARAPGARSPPLRRSRAAVCEAGVFAVPGLAIAPS